MRVFDLVFSDGLSAEKFFLLLIKVQYEQSSSVVLVLIYCFTQAIISFECGIKCYTGSNVPPTP